MDAKLNAKQVEELMLNSLEHELGGEKIYATALRCVRNEGLKKEWSKYLEETKAHVAALEGVCRALGIDAKRETPGRKVVRHVGGALVEAMTMSLEAGDPAAAELVACECVVLAETKDHADWELIGKCVENLSGEQAAAVKKVYEEVEDQEDEHLYHSKGWCRELWIQSLGLPAVLPPLEERQKVKTAIGAARAQAASDKLR